MGATIVNLESVLVWTLAHPELEPTRSSKFLQDFVTLQGSLETYILEGSLRRRMLKIFISLLITPSDNE